jgi:hypothetical protein
LNRFKNIDDKLSDFADKHEGRLTKDRNGFLLGERRIDWKENQICVAIIIQPIFLMTGDTYPSFYNFINVAWIMKNGIAVKPGWKKMLLEKSNYNLIEKEIDELLFQSENNLCNIKLGDIEL